jgi:predicted nucleic acid-binding Zn finger protein
MSNITLRKLSEVINEIALEIEKEAQKNENMQVDCNEVTDCIRKHIFQNVVSETNKDFFHQTNHDNTSCTCPHFKYRLKNSGKMCKHMRKREKYYTLKTSTKNNFYLKSISYIRNKLK